MQKGEDGADIFAEMRPSFPVLVPLYGEKVIFGAIFPFHANALRLPFHAEAKKNEQSWWPVAGGEGNLLHFSYQLFIKRKINRH